MSFLFLLCTEGLHGLIKQAVAKGDITGFALCKRGPKLTHLFFANDNLPLCRATPIECGKMMDLLSAYEGALGQKVNKEKTAIFFSKVVNEASRQLIKGILGVQEIQHYEK